MTVLLAAATLIAAAVVVLRPRAAAGPPPDDADAPRAALATAHFAIDAHGLDPARAAALGAYLEAHRARVLADLDVRAMPAVRVVVQSHADFTRDWGARVGAAGLRFQPKGLTAGGAVYVYGPWAAGSDAGELHRVVLHEFAHLAAARTVAEHLARAGGDTAAHRAAAEASATGQHARWLSESVALHAAGQATDVNTLGYMLRGKYPTLAELDDPTSGRVYEVGYRVAEFVVATWGRERLVALLRADGDVSRVLGLTDAEFSRRWYDWVEDRYLIVKPRWFGRTATR
ncbi:hypothetical protein [Roseisolibacter sp. H3M3-2]|uniref:hypothetical protein n=1 Tax=Roseisolibacter sp. H3M3-2 TaxID=3031323 RepID=UPI0023DA6F73|nr:hypothetical protein [Roseisolibacter sp. H3M3-2]